MPTSLEITNAATKFIIASDKAHEIINGADTETVPTEAGDLPTMAKALKDFPDKCLRFDLDQTGYVDSKRLQAIRNMGLHVLNRLVSAGEANGASVNITDISTPGNNIPLFYAGLYNGKKHWTSDGISLNLATPDVALFSEDGVWNFQGVDYSASKVSDADTPFDLLDWEIGDGLGQPTFEDLNNTPSAIGQKMKIGTNNPLEYFWNDSEWQFSGPQGIIQDNENIGQFRRIIFDGGALSSELYTPAD
jgi:hypothetical protein